MRTLDEALAKGQISPDQHRARRDEVLASATGGAPQGLRWQAQAPGNQEPSGDAERTQVVTSGDAGATAFIRPPAFPPPPNNWPPAGGQQQQATPPPWAAQQQQQGFQQGTPWNQGMQGPEVFEATGKKRTGLWVLVAVLVLALVGGSTWWFGFRDGNTTPAAQQTSTTAEQARTPGLDDLPDPPGKPNANTGEYGVDDAKNRKVLGEADFKAAQTAGVTDVVQKSGSDRGLGYAVAVFGAKDEDAAIELGNAFIQTHTTIGLTPFQAQDVPESVSTTKGQHQDQFLFRAVYVMGSTTIRVGTAAPKAFGEQEAQAAFTAFLDQVIAKVPAK